jgi:nucleosome binding factor SPN SPT16 subunit
MKTVNEDTYHFYEEGGWHFLTGGDDDSADESSTDGSVFEGESAGSEDEFSDSDESGSDFDEGGDSDSGSDASGDDESEGEDWDELERKAKRGTCS